MLFRSNDTATTEIYTLWHTLSLHDALPIFDLGAHFGQLGRHDLEVLGLGFAMAFVSALIAVRTLIGYVKDHSFRPFAYYRIVFGAIVFVYFLGRY